MIGNCDCCDRCDVPGSVVDCPGEPFACHLCQGDTDPDPYCELCLMQVDRGFSRNTVVMCAVDLSSGIAGQIICIECGGDGDWTKFYPEPHLLTEPMPCVECKGTGRIWVSA